jgi:very-short-patch-repair endonuclease
MSAEPIAKAKKSRRLQTDAESLIWHRIRNRQLGHKFRRQAPIGIYTVDFLCIELKLVIEIDGGQHAENQKDEIRTEFLNGLGYKVIRFWNNDVLENIEGVLNTLRNALHDYE